MKKVLSTFIFLIAVSAGVYAQGISGGVKAGLNLSSQTWKGNNLIGSPSALASFHAGAYATLMFTEHLGLQPELLYSIQGYKEGSGSYKAGYVTIPVLVRYNVNDLLSFHVGPQLGLLTSAKVKSGSSSVDVKDQVKGTDVGIAVGGTVDLPMGLNFTLRFYKGLSDVNDTGSSTTVKNYNIQLSAGYKLFGKK